MNEIKFGVWAPDEATFRQSWIDAGILENQDGYVFKPEYPDIELTATQGWSGIIEQTPAIITDGVVVTPAVMVPGWHCNVTVRGPLVDAMTVGLEQYNEDGTLKNVFERTHAVTVFSLIYKPVDPDTKYPAGYQNVSGVVFADYNEFKSPSNVRQ